MREKKAFILLIVAILSLALIAGPGVSSTATVVNDPNPTPSQWTTYQFNPQNTGHLSVSGYDVQPTLMWNRSLGGVEDSTPIIGEEQVFLAQGDGTLTAVDKKTGETTWEYSTTEIEESPVYANGKVIIGTSADPNSVLALNSTTGDVIWNKSNVDGAVQTQPTYNDGTVYVSGFGTFYALDAQTGDEHWNVSLRDRGGGMFFGGGPVVRDNTVFVGVGQIASSGDYGAVMAVDTQTGTVDWETEVKTGVVSSPTATANGISVAANDTVYQLDPTTGEILWNTSFATRVQGSAAYTNGLVVYPTGDGSLIALNETSGNQEWSRELSNYHTPVATPIATNNTIITGRTTIFGIASETGNVQWQRNTYSTPPGIILKSAPAVTNQSLYAIGSQGTVLSLRPQNSSQSVPSITIDSYSVSNATVAVNEAVTIEATVNNRGNAEGTMTVTFYADGEMFTETNVTVGAGATSTVSASTNFETTGTHNVTVNGEDVTNITVGTTGGVVDQYDENNNSVVETTELMTAIGDYRHHNLSVTDLLTVIDDWRANS